MGIMIIETVMTLVTTKMSFLTHCQGKMSKKVISPFLTRRLIPTTLFQAPPSIFGFFNSCSRLCNKSTLITNSDSATLFLSCIIMCCLVFCQSIKFLCNQNFPKSSFLTYCQGMVSKKVTSLSPKEMSVLGNLCCDLSLVWQLVIFNLLGNGYNKFCKDPQLY